MAFESAIEWVKSHNYAPYTAKITQQRRLHPAYPKQGQVCRRMSRIQSVGRISLDVKRDTPLTAEPVGLALFGLGISQPRPQPDAVAVVALIENDGTNSIGSHSNFH
jgi:hypothetical protein